MEKFIHPTDFIKASNDIIHECRKSICDLINDKFDGHYLREPHHPYIKLRSILGVPCITEIKIIDGELKYHSGVWGKDKLIPTSDIWYGIPEQEIIGVYSSLFEAALLDQE